MIREKKTNTLVKQDFLIQIIEIEKFYQAWVLVLTPQRRLEIIFDRLAKI